MPKFITIGYGDREGYDRTAKTIQDAAHAHDEVLQKSGALVGMAGLPVQVRNHQTGGVLTKSGPYGASPLPVAKFAVIEAPTMAEAVRTVAQTPCAVAYGSSRSGRLSNHSKRRTRTSHTAAQEQRR